MNEDVVSANPSRRAWYIAITCFAFALAALVTFFRSTFYATAQIWQSDTYMHGMLVPGIVAWLIWRRRDELKNWTPVPSWWGLLGVLAMSILWLVGNITELAVVQQIAVWMSVSCLVFAFCGGAFSRAILFPLAYMLFAVPMGEELIPWLMDVTAWFSVTAVKLSGIPVYREGHLFQLPSGTFEVAKACSGIRYLIASAALGFLYAYLTYQNYWRRFLFMLVSILLPIFANGLRAYGIVIIAHLSDLKYAVGIDHLIYGWLFFGLVIFLMFWVGSWWREAERPIVAPAAAMQTEAKTWVSVVFAIVAFGTFAGVSGYARTFDARESAYVAVTPVAPPLANWQKTEPDPTWLPVFHGANATLRQDYVRDGRVVSVFAAHYVRQAQGAELINSENTLYDRKKWSMTQQDARVITLSDGRSIELAALEVGRPGAKRAIWFWYEVGGHVTTRLLAAKFFDIWARLTNPTGYAANVIAISTTYADGQTLPEEQMLDVVQQLSPSAMLGSGP